MKKSRSTSTSKDPLRTQAGKRLAEQASEVSKLAAEVNYTYSLATGVSSDPNSALQFFNGGRLYLPISEQPLDWDQRHSFSASLRLGNEKDWAASFVYQFGTGFPYTRIQRQQRQQDPNEINASRLPSTSTLSCQAERFFRMWGQSVTIYVQGTNLLDAKNINSPTFGVFPNPYVNQSGDEYLIYFTETGRAGGAHLQDTNGDGINDTSMINDGPPWLM